jgi:hypothetical protein
MNKDTNQENLEEVSKIKESIYFNKYDNFFCFVCSLVGLISIVVQYGFGELAPFLLIPLIVWGIIVPFYHGYWRGVIKDSIKDRVWGWVCLIFGVTEYFSGIFMIFLQLHFGIKGENLLLGDISIFIIFLGLGTTLAYVFVRGKVARKWYKWNNFQLRFVVKDTLMITAWVFAYIVGSLFLYLGYSLFQINPFKKWGIILIVFSVLFFIISIYLYGHRKTK